ncbi:MAG: hypothetical protein ACRDRW_05815 [Pseudonocardiaceae bacterium]
MRTEPVQTPALAPAYPPLGFHQARRLDPLTAGLEMIPGITPMACGLAASHPVPVL